MPANEKIIKDIHKEIELLNNKYEEFLAAIATDFSKMAFKIEALEKQVAAFGMEKVAADPQAGAVAVPPEELPGFNDLDEFKPESFEGDAPGTIAADKTPEEVKKKSEGLFDDEMVMDESDYQDLLEDEDQEDKEDDGNSYDCPACGGIAIINKSMKRCPECQNYLDWSDES